MTRAASFPFLAALIALALVALALADSSDPFERLLRERLLRAKEGEKRAASFEPPPPSLCCPPGLHEYPYVEELPEAVVKVQPKYPALAKVAGVEGTVMLQVRVLEDGTVGRTKILRSIPLLDRAAVAAVRQWRFKPATSEGKPVAVWVAVPVKFALH